MLIIGASGGVGSYAIQMVAARGAAVIATGLPEDARRLRGLGAADVVDYRGDVLDVVREAHPDGLDGLIELVSFDPQAVAAAAALLRSGGRLASTLAAADVDALAATGVTATNVVALPDRAMLTELITDVAEGRLRVDIEQVLTFEQAMKGLAVLGNGEARGKTVVRVR